MVHPMVEKVVLHGRGLGDGRISVYDSSAATAMGLKPPKPVLSGDWYNGHSDGQWSGWLILSWMYDGFLSHPFELREWVEPQPSKEALRAALKDTAERMVEEHLKHRYSVERQARRGQR